MNYPKSFIDRIGQQLGSDTGSFFHALAEDTPVSVRLNPEKAPTYLFSEEEKVPWCSTGRYLRKRPLFTLDPLFHAGCYYVQEASSMFLEVIFEQLNLRKQKLMVLDACAAPGGKSTHLSSLINKDSLLVANETIASRVSVLRENIIKWGTGNVAITNNDPSFFSRLRGIFDVIVVDAPCSGEGLFRKDPKAIDEWSEELCDQCSTRQQRILGDLLPSLKADGKLIYSTCTYNPKENEENVKWLVQEYGMECIPLSIPNQWGITEMNRNNIFAYSFYPDRTKSEGFFISVLRKKGAIEATVNMRTKSKKVQAFPASAQQKFSLLKEVLSFNDNDLFERQNEVYMFPSYWMDMIEFLFHSLKVKYAGTHVGTIKNDTLLPSHALAMSTQLKKKHDNSVSLTFDEGLKYLRKDDFKKQIENKGWLLVTYDKMPLGWIKSLDNRINNYYPVEWRIRMRNPQ